MVKVFNTKIGQIECSITTDTDNYKRAEFTQTSVIMDGYESFLSERCSYFIIPVFKSNLPYVRIKLFRETFKFKYYPNVDEIEILEQELNKKINSDYINQYELGR